MERKVTVPDESLAGMNTKPIWPMSNGAMFRSLYRCSDAMRMAPEDDKRPNNFEAIFRAMLMAWAAENGFVPDLGKLAHNDRVLYEKLMKTTP